MGSMWIDPPQDPNEYPMVGQDFADFDPGQLSNAQFFPDSRWAADYLSMLYLIDFSKTNPWLKIRAGIKIAPPPVDSQDMLNGIKALVELQQTARVTAMPEIMAQNTNFQNYFCSQLGIYPSTYPNSYKLLKCVARIGELLMVYLKRASRAVRPSQIYPLLTPPVPVPGHSSFPSGHALVSHLMALTATDIVPSFKQGPILLARRIARNREIAGLHFSWDSAGGEMAAQVAFPLIKALPMYASGDPKNPRDLERARAEWA